MKRFSTAVLLASLLILGVGVYATIPSNYPPLQDGDLIFQTSTSSQSSAIFAATADVFTHMGIIKKTGKRIVVIEAVGTVKETPLKEWVNRGFLKRVAIYRNTKLTSEQADHILTAAKKYYGQPYDIFFSFKNNAMYCSELPYLAYQQAGISIGKIQKVSDLNFDNALVKKLIKRRWQRHSECRSKKYDYEKCFDHILSQDLITPASISDDPSFKEIYSNYLFILG